MIVDVKGYPLSLVAFSALCEPIPAFLSVFTYSYTDISVYYSKCPANQFFFTCWLGCFIHIAAAKKCMKNLNTICGLENTFSWWCIIAYQ